MSETTKPATKSRLARQIVLFSYGLLIAMMIVTSLPAFAPEGSHFWFVASIRTVPLLILAYGLMQDNLRTYAWVCFVVLFYFSQAVVNLFTHVNVWAAIIVVISSVSLFLSAMFYIRWEKQKGRML